MDPAEIGRKIKTAYPVYKNIPDELLGARVIQKFPSMGVESSLDIRKKELDIQKRRLIYTDFQKYLLSDPPASFLFFPYYYEVSKK